MDSKITKSPFLMMPPTILLAANKAFKSGFLFLSTGVGTQTIKQFANLRSFLLLVNFNFAELFKSFLLNSKFLSNPLLSSLILFLFISNPITLFFLQILK